MDMDHWRQVIDVGRLAPGDQWDQCLIDRLLDNTLYPTGLQFKRFECYPSRSDGCVLIVPGRYWVGHEAEISMAVARYEWVLFIRTSDEQDLFDVARVDHPNCRFWIQTPRADRDYPDGARFIGVGFPEHFDGLPKEPREKLLPVFLSAQNTHQRRTECFSALEARNYGNVSATRGFTHGMPADIYAQRMCYAKAAPAPSGVFSPDSFRVWEALESHTVPVVDDVSPAYDSRGFWERLCPGAPFPVIEDYADLVPNIDAVLEGWPVTANRVAAWWMRYKRQMAHWLVDDLKTLGGVP